MKQTLMYYLKEMRDISMEQQHFGPADALLLCQLSYLRIQKVIPGFHCKDFPSIRSLRSHPAFDEMFSDPVYGSMYREIYDLIWDSHRYGNIRMAYYMKRWDEESECRFAAVSFFLGNSSTFLAFRGTDETLLSWKEDLNMAHLDHIPSQSMALSYLKGVSRHRPGRLVIGGHSKGGNLAIYAAAKSPEHIQKRISRVYSFDGVGFKASFIHSKGFLKIKNRICKIVPDESLFGMLLHDTDRYYVVESYKTGLAQHDFMNWKIVRGRFCLVPGIKSKSRRVALRINRWVESLSDHEIRRIINKLYDLANGREISTVYELKLSAFLNRFLKWHKEANRQSREEFRYHVKKIMLG